MAYYNQYGSQNENTTYPPQQYSDQAEAAYDPYDSRQPHRTYDQGGFGYSEPGYGGYKDEPGTNVASKEAVTNNAYDNDTFVSSQTRVAEPKTSRALRRWRYEHQGDLWTAGSRVRCCGRFFCCTIMLFLFILISVVLSLLLWIRPPNVEIGDIALATGSPIQLQDDGISVNLAVPISVSNPNYFSVTFDSIDAEIFYPINNTNIGGGLVKGLKIANEKQTNFSVPFSLNYTTSIDPQYKILLDIASRCGFTGGTKSDITVDYQIHLDFKVLFIPIKPTVKNSASFACPFSIDDLADLLKQAGINVSDITSLLKDLL